MTSVKEEGERGASGQQIFSIGVALGEEKVDMTSAKEGGKRGV